MNLSIPSNIKENIFQPLSEANQAFNILYPGDKVERQPVHTVYGGANLFKADMAQKFSDKSLHTLQTYASNFAVFAKVFQLKGYDSLPENEAGIATLTKLLNEMPAEEKVKHPAALAHSIYFKVIEKLKAEALEDFRIDFEDGFGNRPGNEEDETAVQAAKEVAKGMQQNCLPPFIGIRIKPFTEEMKERGLRTLDIFLTTLLANSNRKLPDNFVVMLPKVTIPEQAAALASCFNILEEKLQLEKGILKMEMMVETTQSIMDIQGVNPVSRNEPPGLRFCPQCYKGGFGTYRHLAF